MNESIKTIKGIKRKQKMMKEDFSNFDNIITSIQVDIYDDGIAYISEDGASGSKYNINIKSPKTIVDAFDEYIHDNFGNLNEDYKQKIEPVKDEAQEEVDPAYAQALRDRKDFNKIRERKIKTDLKNALNKKFSLDTVERYNLDESLFENVK